METPPSHTQMSGISPDCQFVRDDTRSSVGTNLRTSGLRIWDLIYGYDKDGKEPFSEWERLEIKGETILSLQLLSLSH